MIGCSRAPASADSAKVHDNTLGYDSALGQESAQGQEIVLTKSTPFNTMFFNPVKDDSMLGDPWITLHDGWYYYTQSGGNHIVITKAGAMTGVSAGLSKEIWNINSQQGLDQIWAPELHFYGGLWYCYFTARQNAADEMRRIFVLRSRSGDPMGEWDFIGKINLPDDQWAIDATFFSYKERLFLIWSGWKDVSEGPGVWRQNLYICELEDPVTVKPGASRVKISGPDHDWETVELPQNEGPEILVSPNNRVFCIYSASFSKSDSYCLGLLELRGEPTDPSCWQKNDSPVFRSAPAEHVYSPGHCSFTESGGGSEHWIMYHAAKDSRSAWDRSARIQQFYFDQEGFPVFGIPRSTNAPYTLPSGEKVNRLLYEAEDAQLTMADVQTTEGASGSGVVKMPELNSSVLFRISVPNAGVYPVYVRYTSSMPMTSQATLRINGERKFNVQFRRCAITGVTTSDMGLTVINVELKAGENDLEFSDSRTIGIDCIILDL